MIILGIDPGYERLGIAIIEKNAKKKDALLYSDCFKTNRAFSHPERLFAIANKCKEVIEKYKPETLGIEILFFSGNQKTALLVSEARGVILSLAAEKQLEIFEFTPGEIKIAITGYGKASKKQVADMVGTLLPFKKIALDDEYDAIAIALTTSACVR